MSLASAHRPFGLHNSLVNLSSFNLISSTRKLTSCGRFSSAIFPAKARQRLEVTLASDHYSHEKYSCTMAAASSLLAICCGPGVAVWTTMIRELPSFPVIPDPKLIVLCGSVPATPTADVPKGK
jgi:hypothetical protein